MSPKQTALSFQSAKFTRLTTTGNATGAAISPDGKWLVHVMDDGMQQSLWLRQVAIANSNTQIVPPAAVSYVGIAFAPDGNYVYYTIRENSSDAGTLYQMPVLGGTSRKVLTGIWGSVTFSPDGKRMAYFGFHGNEDRLMIANADGTGERQLAARHGDEFFFAGGFSCVSWSRDGKTLASPIGSNPENYMSVVTVSVENAEIKFFTPQKWQTVAQVAWFSDGNRLLVTAQEPGSDPFTFGIWQVSYPAGEAHKITNDLNSYRNISLTSDGNLLAAVQTQVNANLWIMPGFDVARATQITHGTNLNAMASWTPDNKIIYMSNADGSHNLYLSDPRGGNAKQLTANSRGNIFPSVSPDGRYIVFESTRTGVPHIWRMDINGENPKQLTNGFDSNPSVSPDGQWLVYVNDANMKTIWKVGIDGGQPVQITDKSSHMPVISPDGKQIACEYEEPNSPSKLAILPSEGGQPIKTLPLPNGFMPTDLRWTRDGRGIVYDVTRGGVTNLWVQPIDGSPPKQLTNFTSDRIFLFDFSRDGKQVALSRGTLTRDVVLISNFR
jgi:Tol biopolymer transport system component